MKRLTLLLMLSSLLGCGYSTGSLMPANVRTISIPVFGNNTFRRGFEISLTEAVAKELQTRWDIRVTETPYADTLLEVTITDFNQPVLIEDPQDRPTEIGVTVVINMKWKDLRTGETLFEIEGLSASDTFVTPLGQNFDGATREAFSKMAEYIVNQMENRDW